jgi:hypothetical protein
MSPILLQIGIAQQVNQSLQLFRYVCPTTDQAVAMVMAMVMAVAVLGLELYGEFAESRLCCSKVFDRFGLGRARCSILNK